MPDSPANPALPFNLSGDGNRLILEGALNIRTLRAAGQALGAAKRGKGRSLDLRGLSDLDTPGALLLCDLRSHGVELTGISKEHRALLDLVCSLQIKPLPGPRSVPRWRQLIIRLGRAAVEVWHETLAIVAFAGRAASTAAHSVIRPASLRFPAISRHIEETGIDALPIVGMMAVMISIVIGYQGVAQLRPFGGQEFTVNLVAVSVLREMGVLITAIMVAGRSGSAFTAEIGVMQAREEVDSLRVMGIDPMHVLVVPRLIGLMIALPLLTFFAEVMGLLGGAVICHSLLDLSLAQYFDRVHEAVTGYDLFVGLVKAPVFAFFIAVIGCMHGLRVKGSAESVGAETTRAVVKGIFLVIVLDGLFSILFERLGI
jgi:phospholipid/cholesterol/gamma-HCH transport system permease protein